MNPFKWIYHKVKHKLQHYSLTRFKNLLKEHGWALLIIFVAWEIVEDVLFPVLFIWLGNNVNPWFLTGAPIAWLVCLHPIAVPVLWGIWIKISKKKVDE